MFTRLKVLLRHRGYSTEPKETFVLSLVPKETNHVLIHVLQCGHTVIMQNNRSTKKSDITQIIDFMSNLSITKKNIIFTSVSISRPALIFLESFDDWAIEYIESELYSFDRIDSCLVPRYTILTESDIQKIEKIHLASRSKWPILNSTDPIARYMGIYPGQCVSYGVDEEVRIVVKQ
jgi:DNA-directed RNA polymerase subunit H (RpoH/RPB5)